MKILLSKRLGPTSHSRQTKTNFLQGLDKHESLKKKIIRGSYVSSMTGEVKKAIVNRSRMKNIYKSWGKCSRG